LKSKSEKYADIGYRMRIPAVAQPLKVDYRLHLMAFLL